MKIGIIIGSLGLGGSERVSVRLGKWFIDKGHDVVYITTKPIPPKEYPLPIRAERTICKGTGFKLIKQIRTAIKDKRPNVIVVMDTPMCVYAVPAIIGTNVPFVVSERSMPNSPNIKKITRILSQILSYFTDYFVFQTTEAQSYYSKFKQKKSCVIPNPLDENELPDPYTKERSKRIVAFARIIKGKNHEMLINAFVNFNYKHSDFTLEIYGDGSNKANIEEYIRTLPTSRNISMMGAHHDVLNKVVDATAFVLTSDFEGMPNTLIEAMALGIPSISTDCPCGGPRDLIENGINGILVPVNDPAALSEALCFLVEHPIEAEKIGQKAVKIRSRLNMEVIGTQWINVLKKIIK